MDLREYCFLDNVIEEEFNPDTYCYNGSEKKTTINGKQYKDPDGHSKKLYEILFELWGSKLDLVKAGSKCMFKYSGGNVTSDYIGPSKTHAAKKPYLISDKEVGKFLKKTRTIGGHIIWPSKTHNGKSINTARNNKTYERMDITLYSLKNWYENKYDITGMHEQYEGSRDWFYCDQYDNFNDFINFYQLNPYVNDDYEVYDLTANWHTKLLDDTSCEKIPNEEIFKLFIKNSIRVIKERNELIATLHKETLREEGNSCQDGN